MLYIATVFEELVSQECRSLDLQMLFYPLFRLSVHGGIRPLLHLANARFFTGLFLSLRFAECYGL